MQKAEDTQSALISLVGKTFEYKDKDLNLKIITYNILTQGRFSRVCTWCLVSDSDSGNLHA